MITEINTTADVQAFAHQLFAEGLTGGFHPDDPFEDFVDANGDLLYTPEESTLRDGLMERCFEVCGDDVYEIMGRITLMGSPAESIFDEDHEERHDTFMQLVKLGLKEYKPNGIGSRATKEILLSHYN